MESPKDTIKKTMLSLYEVAKENLEANDNLMPVGFIIGRDFTPHMCPCPWRNQAEKRVYLLALGTYAKENDAEAIILIVDTWISKAPKKTEDGEFIRPSLDPNRSDALMATIILPDSSILAQVVQPYERDGKKVIWEKEMPDMTANTMQFMISPWRDVKATN